jgi:ankyrin repeat protein
MHTAEIDLGPKAACITGYADFSDYRLMGSVETTLDDAIAGVYQHEEMTLISKKNISLHGYEGRELLLQLSPRYGKDTFAIARIYLAYPRLYVNIIGGPNSSEIYRDRFKFLDSFRILNTPLIEAAEKGQTNLLRNLLAESTDEKEKDIALVRAAKSGSLAGVKALFNAGVRINAKDDSERTALMMAAGYSTPVDNRVESCVTFLLSAGADPNAQDPEHQWSALVWSIVEGQGNAALALIKAGTDVNLRDRTGETALTHAKKLNSPEIIEALVKAGALE